MLPIHIAFCLLQVITDKQVHNEVGINAEHLSALRRASLRTASFIFSMVSVGPDYPRKPATSSRDVAARGLLGRSMIASPCSPMSTVMPMCQSRASLTYSGMTTWP